MLYELKDGTQFIFPNIFFILRVVHQSILLSTDLHIADSTYR